MKKGIVLNKKFAVVMTVVVSLLLGTVINFDSWCILAGDVVVVRENKKSDFVEYDIVANEDTDYEDTNKGTQNEIQQMDDNLDEIDNEEIELTGYAEDDYLVYDEDYNLVNDFSEEKQNNNLNALANLGNINVKVETLSNKQNVENKQESNKKLNVSDSELKYLACIIYAESRGECYAGKIAVGNVVLNRYKSKRYPNTIKKVITQKGQFGPSSNGALNKALNAYTKGYFTKQTNTYKAYKHSLSAAKKALSGYNNIGKRYSFNNKRATGYKKNQKIIGNHKFW